MINRVVCSQLLVVIVAAPSFALPNKVLEWTFDTHDATMTFDSSGNGNHGTKYMGGLYAYPDGVFGIGDSVRLGRTIGGPTGSELSRVWVDDVTPPVAKNLPIGASDPWTISMFVQFDPATPPGSNSETIEWIGGFGGVGISGEPTSFREIATLFGNTGSPETYLWGFNVGGDIPTGAQQFTPGQWQLVAATYDGVSNARLYLYELDGSGGVIGQSNNYTLLDTRNVAGISWGDNPNGVMYDNFTIWDGALTQSEVEDLLNPPFDADFDDNNIVNGGDFLTWQRNFPTNGGATNAEGDANADGNVLADDLGIWETQYGGPPPVSATSSGAATVPEPSSLALALLAAWALVSRRR